MGWNNPTVDALIDQLDTEFNAQKRLDLIHGIVKAYTSEVPVLPLYYRSDVAVIPTSIKGFKLTGHQFSETNNIEDWDLSGSLVN